MGLTGSLNKCQPMQAIIEMWKVESIVTRFLEPSCHDDVTMLDQILRYLSRNHQSKTKPRFFQLSSYLFYGANNKTALKNSE